MSHMKTEPAAHPATEVPRRLPPQGAVGHPDSGSTLSPRPPTQLCSEGYSGAEEKPGDAGEAVEPSGTCPGCGRQTCGPGPPAQARVRLCPGSARSPKPQGGGQQANEAGRTPPPGRVTVWWQGHLGCAGPLMESAGTCNKERVGVAQRGQLAAKPVGWRKREQNTDPREGGGDRRAKPGWAGPASTCGPCGSSLNRLVPGSTPSSSGLRCAGPWLLPGRAIITLCRPPPAAQSAPPVAVQAALPSPLTPGVSFPERPLLSASLDTDAPFYIMM